MSKEEKKRHEKKVHGIGKAFKTKTREMGRCKNENGKASKRKQESPRN